MYLTISGSSTSGMSFVANTPCDLTAVEAQGVTTYAGSNNRVLALYNTNQSIRTYLATATQLADNPPMVLEAIS